MAIEPVTRAGESDSRLVDREELIVFGGWRRGEREESSDERGVNDGELREAGDQVVTGEGGDLAGISGQNSERWHCRRDARSPCWEIRGGVPPDNTAYSSLVVRRRGGAVNLRNAGHCPGGTRTKTRTVPNGRRAK